MEEKIPGVSHLPDWVTEPLNDIFDGINKLTLASNVMVGFYIMSVVLTAFAFIGGCLTFFVRDNLAYFVNCVWCGVSFPFGARRRRGQANWIIR